jgi:Recombinase
MKPILIELSHLPSARQIAAELNRRGIKSATGGQWSSKTVVRLRERLILGVKEIATHGATRILRKVVQGKFRVSQRAGHRQYPRRPASLGQPRPVRRRSWRQERDGSMWISTGLRPFLGCDRPRREAERIRVISGIGHRRSLAGLSVASGGRGSRASGRCALWA